MSTLKEIHERTQLLQSVFTFMRKAQDVDKADDFELMVIQPTIAGDPAAYWLCAQRTSLHPNTGEPAHRLLGHMPISHEDFQRLNVMADTGGDPMRVCEALIKANVAGPQMMDAIIAYTDEVEQRLARATTSGPYAGNPAWGAF